MKRFIPQKVKDLFKQVLSSNSSTKDIAGGLGIGIFIAFLPIVGIQMYVSLAVTRLFKKNSIVAILAAWITNPLTVVPIYLGNLWVGNLFYPNALTWDVLKQTIIELNWRNMFDVGLDFLIPLWIGSLIVGTIMGFLSQRLCLAYYDRLKEKFRKKENHEPSSS